MSLEVIDQPHPLLQVVRHELDTSQLPLAAAQAELEVHIAELTDSSYTWGYFPGYKQDSKDYPASMELADQFERLVLDEDLSLKGLNLRLAFVRRAIGAPQSEYKGLHVDVNRGIEHVRDASWRDNTEIIRHIFNIATVPRALLYAPESFEDLEDAGLVIPRHSYHALTAAELAYVTPTTVDAPPIEPDGVYELRLVSSQVLHFGDTGEDGHFVISYGGFVTPKQAQSIFGKSWGEL